MFTFSVTGIVPWRDRWTWNSIIWRTWWCQHLLCSLLSCSGFFLVLSPLLPQPSLVSFWDLMHWFYFSSLFVLLPPHSPFVQIVLAPFKILIPPLTIPPLLFSKLKQYISSTFKQTSLCHWHCHSWQCQAHGMALDLDGHCQPSDSSETFIIYNIGKSYYFTSFLRLYYSKSQLSY